MGSGPDLPARRPFYEIVALVLQNFIRDGALPPGAVIREKAVGDAFGIGRVPVGVALTRLEAQRLVHRRPPMHGVVVGTDRATPLLTDVPLPGLPKQVEAELKIRNWRTLIYPQVEREVASCLLFGRFQIRGQALAEHFRVSRTVAHELLLRLERVGLVRQEANARWYAGPLTPTRIHDLYQLRILLEPAALLQAAPLVGARAVQQRLARVVRAGSAQARSDTSLLHRLEVDLHQDIVLHCTNAELRNTLHRCQLPLISVHLSFSAYDEPNDIPEMIGAHRQVLAALAAGDAPAAAAALEAHLRRSSDGNPQRLSALPQLDRRKLAGYLDPA